MNTTNKGNIGFLAACIELTKQGYSVFIPLADNAPNDLLVLKDNVISKVEVKYTSQQAKSGGWLVEIKQARHNRTQNINKSFDNTKVDLLAVFVEKEDRVVLLDAKTIIAISQLTIPSMPL